MCRSILDADARTSHIVLFSNLKCITIPEQITYKRNLMVHKILKNHHAPIYLKNMFTHISDISTHTMERRLSIHNLYLTRPRTSNYKNSFAYSAAKSYTNLANKIKQATTIPIFKRLYLKEFLK